MNTDWQSLDRCFHALIHAMHARITHAKVCAGCQQCAEAQNLEYRKRDEYAQALKALIG